MNKKIAAMFLSYILLTAVGCSPSVQKSTKEPVAKTATVSGVVTDTEGKWLIAQLVFKGEEHLSRINTDILGRFSLELPLGEYTVEITKGSEYERKNMELEVTDRRAKYVGEMPLKKLYETDWIAGDLHQHSVYSFDGLDSPADILLSDLSMGMRFGVITDHNDIRANGEFTDASLEGFIPFAGIEITTGKGHFNAINFNKVIDSDVSQGTADVLRIIKEVREADEAILQVNHPLRDGFTFDDWDLIRQFDVIEVWNGKSVPPYVEGEPNALTRDKWFSTLNEGLFVPTTAGSDNHDISGNRMFASGDGQSEDEDFFLTSMYSGMPRNYVYTQTPDAAGILGALRRGNSFLTNNPLAYLDVEGAIPGESTGPGAKGIHVRIQSNRELMQYRIIKNGELFQEENVSGLVTERTIPAELMRGDWIVLEVRGKNGEYALTNPVFIK